MSKKTPLQAYNNLCAHLDFDTTDYMFNGGYEEDDKIIETALKRLEEIDNKPVAFVVSNRGIENAIIKEISKHKEIKITNLADQKKLRALEIVQRTGVNIRLLKETDNAIEYNELIKSHYGMVSLSTKEYEFLKEMFK